MIFRKWGGGVKGRFEFFRKFISLGSLTRPLSSIFVPRRWQMGVQTKLCYLNNSSLSMAQIINGVETKIIQNLYLSPKFAWLFHLLPFDWVLG